MEERSSFVARAVMGSNIGLVVNFPLCALLVESLGWESAFYIIGASTLVWVRAVLIPKIATICFHLIMYKDGYSELLI